MKKEKKHINSTVLNIIITLIFGAVYYYFFLPPINLQSTDFWIFLLLLLGVFLVLNLLGDGVKVGKNFDGRVDAYEIKLGLKNAGKKVKIPFYLMLIIVAFCLIATFFSSTIFHAAAYSELLNVQEGNFSEDVAEISYSEIPMLDKDSSIQLGKRALGSISSNSNLVSQFEVSDEEYAQINYQGQPVRVAPLRYGNIIKWFNNLSEGLPGYIVVNMVTQEAKLVQLDEGIKYSTADHFGRNLNRVLRFAFPTMMFGDTNFEIDEDGNPWWVCSRVVKTIGLFGGEDIQGAVLVNAITGECTYYDEVPSWVDRVYDADLVVQQYDYHGSLSNGWINSWLGQKGVTHTTSGYNYIALNDDVYLYTGVTSSGEDESNVGFILVNQRTKDARYYNITGAEEYSAMSSAEGAVQHLNYTATFPILLNISDEPTYFMALKDSADLVKMYAMVNVKDYQITATGTSVMSCQESYEELLLANGIKVESPIVEEPDEPEADTQTVQGTIDEIRSAVVDGNTIFYFRLTDSPVYYAVSAADCQQAVIFNIGQNVVITYIPGDGSILTAKDIIAVPTVS